MNLTIKNVPKELYQRLKRSAEQHRRSLNSEILVNLEKAIRSARIDVDDFLVRLDRLHGELSLPPLTDDVLRGAKKKRPDGGRGRDRR
jgi:plasmid stability protein